MPAEASPVRAFSGARVRFEEGQARLLPEGRPPDGFVAGRFSVLSPGTEHRHLVGTTSGPARKAGYMSLGQDVFGGWVLAPVPHGAAFDPGHPGAVTAPPGMPVELVALARFQQIAVLGLDRLPVGVDVDGAVVLGSGPVALGSVLELHRRGATGIRVLTSRPAAPIGRAPNVRLTAEPEKASAGVVIDAVGAPTRAASLVGQDGILGLLGTPEEIATVSALALHRGGWTVVGMHELAELPPGRYQAAYATASAWLAEQVDARLAASWCRRIPGERAPRVFETLGQSGRPQEPVVVFEWTP